MKRDNKRKGIKVLFIALFLALGFSATTMAQQTIIFSDEQVENLVRCSYQYVAMFNVIQKLALDPNTGGIFTDGFNNPIANTMLLDHTMRSIARPNNDTFFQGAVLDLNNDAVIIEFPLIDTKYAVLETSGYAHYIEVPLANSSGDFKKPTTFLFYTEHTDGYQGQAIEGVDRIVKSDDDYLAVFLRAMPHQGDPERMAKIKEALGSIKIITLSTLQGKPAKSAGETKFPAYGKTDGDLFADNLLEVMQFVFNHTAFDPDDETDRAVLALYKPLGVEPGKVFEASNVANLDGPMVRAVADKMAKQALADMANPTILARI